MKTFEEILKEINLLEKKSLKLSQSRLALMIQLKSVCPHTEIIDYYDSQWPSSTHVRYCKLCKSEDV